VIDTLREVLATIRDDLGQLDAALVSAQVDNRELPSLPMATALVELAKAQERLGKTAARIIAIARTPPPEPGLFDNDQDDPEET
jgi:hypothetical protein